MVLGALRRIWPSAAEERHRSWHRFDTLAVLVVLAVTVVYLQGRWRGELPFLDHDGDTTQLASFCAALDHPQLFARDPLLSDPRNFGFYTTIQIPFARLMARVVGDYGTALLLPLPALLFTQGMGFYRLGRALYRNRVLALTLALSTYLYYPLKILADYWGTRAFVTPRDWFQAALPLLLAYLIERRGRPRSWVVAHFLLGLLIYVHPVSTPPWALALWLGTWFFQPRGWSFGRRVKWMAACAAAFFVAAVPFAVHYFASYSHGATVDYDDVYRVVAARYATGFTDIPLTFRNFWWIATHQYWLQTAAVGAVVVWLALRRDRAKLLAVLAWCAALAFIAFVFPYYEQEYARAHRVMPLEVDFVRSCRYLFMLLHLLCLWPLAALVRVRPRSLAPDGRTRTGERVRWLLWTAAASAAIVWQARRSPWEAFVDDGLAAIEHGRLFKRSEDERLPVMRAVRDLTPPGSKLMVADSTLASEVRFFALRPVAWSYKDGGPFGYANHRALLAWAEEIDRIAYGPRGRGGLRSWFQEGRRLGADYTLLKMRVPPELVRRSGGEVVFTHHDYVLVKL